MEKGFANERNFAKFLDIKKVKELPRNYQEMLYSLFENANEESIIECWQSKYLEKADIKIKINNEIKGISIKTGINCSMHQESCDKFYNFLAKIGVTNSTINDFKDFMLGEVNGERVYAVTYVNNNKDKINKIRDELNNYYIKTNLIIRFIFQGTEIQKYDCDAIVYGTPKKFIWATKDEILKYLIEYQTLKYNQINISALNIKAYNRNLRNNPKKIKHQNNIQVKWYTLKRDLEIITKSRNNYKNQTQKLENMFIKN